MKSWFLLIVSVVLIAAAGVATYFGFYDRTGFNNENVNTTTNTARLTISQAAARAFGDFGTNKLTPVALTQSGEKSSTGATDSSSGSSVNGTVTEEPTTIQYSYTGEISIPNLPVLKRAVTTASSNYGAAVANGFASWINPKAFNNLDTDTVTMSESGDSGYQVSVDFRTGQASIFQKYSIDQPVSATTKEIAVNTNLDKAMPSDSALVSIARKFLQSHGISYAGYGEEVVAHNDYYILQPETTDSASVWMSQIGVVFPWEINGISVVDDTGRPYGMTVSIDTDSQKVVGVDGITDLNFISSTYPLVTDKAKILKFAQQGGVYGGLKGTTSKTVTVALKDPQVVYMISRYQLNSDGLDYLVPALKFPISTPPSGVTIYQSSVVIPLIDELLNEMAPTPITDTISTTPTSTSSSSAER